MKLREGILVHNDYMASSLLKRAMQVLDFFHILTFKSSLITCLENNNVLYDIFYFQHHIVLLLLGIC